MADASAEVVLAATPMAALPPPTLPAAPAADTSVTNTPGGASACLTTTPHEPPMSPAEPMPPPPCLPAADDQEGGTSAAMGTPNTGPINPLPDPPPPAVGAPHKAARAQQAVHNAREYPFYCCECNVLCGPDELIMNGTHKAHDYIYAVEQAKIVYEDLSKHEETTRAAMPDFHFKLKEVMDKMNEFDAAITEQEESVERNFETLYRALDKKKAAVMNELARVRREKMDRFEGIVSMMKQAVERTEQALAQLPQLGKDVEECLPQGLCSPVMRSLVERRGLGSPGDTGEVAAATLGSLFGKARSKGMALYQPKAKHRSQPPVGSALMQWYVVAGRKLQAALATIAADATYTPPNEVVEVFFNKTAKEEIDRYARIKKHIAGFQTPSRTMYGGVHIQYRPKQTPDRGLIWYIVTNNGEHKFKNPYTNGMIKVRCSAAFEIGDCGTIVDRRGSACLTKHQKGASLTITFDSKMSFTPTHFTIQHGAEDDAHALRSFVLEGSTRVDGAVGHDTTAFTPLCTVTNNLSLADKPYQVTPFNITPPVHKAFNTFRLRMTGKNANPDANEWYKLCLGGIEFYGVLYTH